jgi:hypothetical protein
MINFVINSIFDKIITERITKSILKIFIFYNFLNVIFLCYFLSTIFYDN